MVILVELAEEDDPASSDARNGCKESDDDVNDRPNLNINSFSNALGCYPIVSQIAQHLDQNSLHDLSLTCREFRANLLQFQSSLVRQTLRCVNDEKIALKVNGQSTRPGETWSSVHTNGQTNGHVTHGYVGRCARDMVSECRRCGIVVCRNCVVSKTASLKSGGVRHRRLCRTCIKAPLHWHTMQIKEATPLSDSDRRRSSVTRMPEPSQSFTSEAFSRDPCMCELFVFLCDPCGNGLRSADITYMRGWNWRTRYSTYLGGLGTGIGEGNEGVECGKGSDCLAAREVEKEIDCDAEELADMKREIEKVEREGRQWGGTSFMMQEIEGIGGVVKKKVKKRIKVGQVVKEYEDERETCKYLGREKTGLNRSWCSWCSRIIPGNKDEESWAWKSADSDSSSSRASSTQSG